MTKRKDQMKGSLKARTESVDEGSSEEPAKDEKQESVREERKATRSGAKWWLGTSRLPRAWGG